MGGAIPFNKSFTASSYGNSTELNLFNSTDGTSQLKYYVIYTEEMCLLTKLLHRSNDSVRACELFVREDYNETGWPLCEHYFECYCDYAIQWLYNKTKCDSYPRTQTESTTTPKR
ncbi:uncharacterized protein LOC144167231 isoform X2 [Haemaphysalis longicornis]